MVNAFSFRDWHGVFLNKSYIAKLWSTFPRNFVKMIPLEVTSNMWNGGYNGFAEKAVNFLLWRKNYFIWYF